MVYKWVAISLAKRKQTYPHILSKIPQKLSTIVNCTHWPYRETHYKRNTPNTLTNLSSEQHTSYLSHILSAAQAQSLYNNIQTKILFLSPESEFTTFSWAHDLIGLRWCFVLCNYFVQIAELEIHFKIIKAIILLSLKLNCVV